jgi:hypothetical protein
MSDSVVDQVRQDLMVLAGRILHRGAQTNEERDAADYIRDRLRTSTPDVEVDNFHAIDNYFYLFASYYTEFLVVAVLALWWPTVAFVYGLAVFAAYLGEFLGFRLFSRLLPQFESQNVAARLHAPRPRHLFIITAYYDSGCATPISHPDAVPWMRSIHRLLVLCMVVVLATCAADAFGAIQGQPQALASYVRWIAVTALICGAILLFYSSAQAEDVRGANFNASGVAALLRLAERFKTQPLDTADVWLVATGCHESWMAGIHRLLTTQPIDKHNTYILNLEGVGAGNLRYCVREGLLYSAPASSAMVKAAASVADAFGVQPATQDAIPTEAQVALTRGYQALTIMALDEDTLPLHWNWYSDLVTQIEEKTIVQAANFAEALLRRLERDLEEPTAS